jgi:LysR family transcriptional activator of nhaA
MATLNYNHLFYFWMVAREGSIAAACLLLGVSQPAVSSTIMRLERALGVKLFEKSGRGLALTPAGTTVYAYADEIFALGKEMLETLERGGHRPLRLAVGVTDGMPPTLMHRLLAPAQRLARPVRLVVRHGPLARLSAELGARELDVVFSAERVPAGSAVRARAHPLGSCGLTFLAAAALAAELAERFPSSLDGAPFITTHAGTPLRRALDAWLQASGVAPTVAAEMDDWAAMLLLAQSGAGVVAVPTAAAEEVRSRHELERLGEAADATQHFFALTVERRPRHSAVVAILDANHDDPIH